MGSLPKKFPLFRGGLVFYCYFCDMYHTLFPDFFSFDDGRSQEQALRLNEALQQVELALLDTHAERRAVLRRLATLGVTNAWQLLQLQHEEVAEWPGVGPAFLSVLDEMREEVHRAPEQLVDTWRREWATLTFPDDMEEETHIALSDTDSAEEVPEKKSTDTEYECLSAEACKAERTLAALLHTLLHRRPVGAGVLRRYFLEGLPVSTIVRVEGLASRAAVHRVVDRQCLRPLLSGEALHGLQLSAAFLAKLEQLRGRLIFCPSTVLECLHTMLPERFLRFLHLTLLCRTTAETQWGADLIVPRHAVLRARRLLRRTMQQLQWQPDFVKRTHLAVRLHSSDASWLQPLLHRHPWVERNAEGYRLRSEQLQYDVCRTARILCDAAGVPCSLQEVRYAYECRYLERPKRLSLSGVQARFPQISTEDDRLWQWKNTSDAP